MTREVRSTGARGAVVARSCAGAARCRGVLFSPGKEEKNLRSRAESRANRLVAQDYLFPELA
eukprot:29239-Pelagococcus_subviridis.AAC.7